LNEYSSTPPHFEQVCSGLSCSASIPHELHDSLKLDPIAGYMVEDRRLSVKRYPSFF
jgi:hypothetical protein